MSQRITVFDPVWEEDLLKAVIEFPDDQPTLDALQVVRPEWFLVGMHRAMWDIILQVHGEQGFVDEVAVLTATRKSPRFTEGDRSRILDEYLTPLYRQSAGAGAPMRALQEAHLRRTLTKLAGQVGAASADFFVDMEDLKSMALKVADAALSEADREDLQERDLSDLVTCYLGGQALMPANRARNLVRFGVQTLDDALVAGPGAFGVVAAKSSAGKTSFIAQALVESELAGIPSALFSFEMDREEVGARIIANATGTHSGLILRQDSDFPRMETERLRAARRIKTVTKIPGRAFSGVAAKIRQMVARYGIRLVVVDYFTLINPPETGRNRSRNDAAILGDMSKGFKALASDLGIVVLLVSQLNRTVKDGERPTLECLRETGQLEQDANFVIFLWTEKADYAPNEDRVVFGELAKNRGGARWVKARMMNNPATAQFREDVSETAHTPAPPPRVQRLGYQDEFQDPPIN